jgi:hypothetical protein
VRSRAILDPMSVHCCYIQYNRCTRKSCLYVLGICWRLLSENLKIILYTKRYFLFVCSFENLSLRGSMHNTIRKKTAALLIANKKSGLE